ncbi:MAG: glutamine synthetase III [Clostridia bacterium]|nr:glutamine synthetase III [Clostridia bacterium]
MTNREKITDNFGVMLFSEHVMKERLTPTAYESVRLAKERGTPLSHEVAKCVAKAMLEWAVEHGATHYTHWFQPMTGITAEKHDAFIEPHKITKEPILKLSERSLVKGEADASSFPSGGLRATFEARGYTAWDPTSYAFVKDGSLYIPTAFCSYGGEALDKKTPLLRSIDALNVQAMRILRLFGDEKTKRVIPTVGAEQEYFLIDKSVYEKRVDLIHCGRTLFGARPTKGQELEDHYYGSIKPRVAAFMKELDTELWRMGIYAKTKHNEAAPAQHELACIYESSNVATDQNQIVMDLMKSIAGKHDLVCLLHEKPFASVSGSGKHNNWSLSTDSGENIFEPGATPNDNARFLLFLLAVISAVDKHQDLLRISIASAGNDHRLGASEAPPAIVSIYLGEELEAILDAIERGESYHASGSSELKVGISTLPTIQKDSTDRNRTSPFAFTGNKFEFRMVGAPANIGCPNFIINTIVADELRAFADELEGKGDLNTALSELFRKTVKAHKRIIYSGNSYSDEWRREAARRGLLNLESTPDALLHYPDKKNVTLFESHSVLTESEICSRGEILLENYAKTVHIEALTALDMARMEILPSIVKYQDFLLAEIIKKKSFPALSARPEEDLVSRISSHLDSFYSELLLLEESLEKYPASASARERAFYSKDKLLASMERLRGSADRMELLIGKEFLPYPSYEDILYSVKY